MSEREPNNDSGFVVNESQSRFFGEIGMDIPVSTVIPFKARHLQIMQGRAEGLSTDELALRLGKSEATIGTYANEVAKIGQMFAVGSNGFEAAISYGVAIGKISVSGIMTRSGDGLDGTEAEILGFMVQGYNSDEISRTLKIDLNEVRYRKSRIYEKLRIDNSVSRKSPVAVGIAVGVLKQKFEQGEEQA